MKADKRRTVALLLLGIALSGWAQTGWPNYGNDGGGTRYSAARQIDRSNVGRLQPLWTYRTGALEEKTALIRKAAFEATPILVGSRLFLSTPYNHVIALNPQNGARLWEYDAHVDLSKGYSEVSSRGVSAWEDPDRKPGQACRLRIFMGTLDGRLIALDGETGKPCLDFGDKGEVNLAVGAATATEWTGG
jgi:quinoprotein glucose dehydrogenase